MPASSVTDRVIARGIPRQDPHNDRCRPPALSQRPATLVRVAAAAIDGLLALRIEQAISLVLWFVLLVVKAFALCDAVTRRDEFFVAADKQNKVFWLMLLGVFLVLHVLFRNSVLFNMVGTVAALVYLLDVRPILRTMHHR